MSWPTRCQMPMAASEQMTSPRSDRNAGPGRAAPCRGRWRGAAASAGRWPWPPASPPPAENRPRAASRPGVAPSRPWRAARSPPPAPHEGAGDHHGGIDQRVGQRPPRAGIGEQADMVPQPDPARARRAGLVIGQRQHRDQGHGQKDRQHHRRSPRPGEPQAGKRLAQAPPPPHGAPRCSVAAQRRAVPASDRGHAWRRRSAAGRPPPPQPHRSRCPRNAVAAAPPLPVPGRATRCRRQGAGAAAPRRPGIRPAPAAPRWRRPDRA